MTLYFMANKDILNDSNLYYLIQREEIMFLVMSGIRLTKEIYLVTFIGEICSSCLNIAHCFQYVYVSHFGA